MSAALLQIRDQLQCLSFPPKKGDRLEGAPSSSAAPTVFNTGSAIQMLYRHTGEAAKL